MGEPRRRLAYAVLEPTDAHSRVRPAVSTFLVAVVLVSVAALALDTVEPLASRFSVPFAVIELLAMVVMAAEYAVRFWIAPEHEADGETDPLGARLRYARSPLGIIDLVSVLPALLQLTVPMDRGWLHVLQFLRLFKLARYAPALSLFAAVIRSERRPLLAAVLVMSMLLMLNSAVMFVLEREAQPKVFASIPHTMWWAVVTMATVGYGDMFPVTPAGKVFGGVVMLIGIAMFAVPAGILATGFAIELRKRDFVVTWHTVAGVPLFAGLDAARIAEIARLLKREVVPAKYAIVRRGEPADAMFFIMTGEVEVDVRPVPRRLGRGQYFGEIALLHDTVRTATVTTLTECQLLVLDVADFRRLVASHADVQDSIARVAAQRVAADAKESPASPPA